MSDSQSNPSPSLPLALDNLYTLLQKRGTGTGWLLKILARELPKKTGEDDLLEAVRLVAESVVDDYFTSRVSERVIEPTVKKMVRRCMEEAFDNLQDWSTK